MRFGTLLAIICPNPFAPLVISGTTFLMLTPLAISSSVLVAGVNPSLAVRLPCIGLVETIPSDSSTTTFSPFPKLTKGSEIIAGFVVITCPVSFADIVIVPASSTDLAVVIVGVSLVVGFSKTVNVGSVVVIFFPKLLVVVSSRSAVVICDGFVLDIVMDFIV